MNPDEIIKLFQNRCPDCMAGRRRFALIASRSAPRLILAGQRATQIPEEFYTREPGRTLAETSGSLMSSIRHRLDTPQVQCFNNAGANVVS